MCNDFVSSSMRIGELVSENEKCSVAILAGGKGTRLRERFSDIPKPLVPILGKSTLQHQIELCKLHGFHNIALLVCHQYEKILDYFGDGARFGVNLVYVIEAEPRGTAGALLDALPVLAERFLVLYADTFLDVNLGKLWDSHVESGADGTLFLHPNDHPFDSDIVEIDQNGVVENIWPYPHPEERELPNLTNAALYVMNRASLENLKPSCDEADIAKHMFPLMLSLGCALVGYVSSEYIKDMGTPERLDKVERDIVNGVPDRLSMRNSRSAVFLDRDGCINYEVDHINSPDQLALLPGATEAIRALNESGVLAVVVTNQPVVARGDVSFAELSSIHCRLEKLLGSGRAFLNGIYFCPHHPESGFPGEIAELKTECICRKPEPGLINQACRDLDINLANSWMIGDTTSDVEAGRRAGVRTVLLRTGYAGRDAKFSVRPDYTAYDLAEAVDWILHGYAKMRLELSNIVAQVNCDTRLILIGGLARSGKSYTAQVLKDILSEKGRTAHVISLDGWLKPKEMRQEGSGVCERYDLEAASFALAKVVFSDNREIFVEPQYDRFSRSTDKQRIEHSVAPEDLLIVEGVPALLIKSLVDLSGVIKLYVQVEDNMREARLKKEYAWRSTSAEEYAVTQALRKVDEIPLVQESRARADHVLNVCTLCSADDRVHLIDFDYKD